MCVAVAFRRYKEVASKVSNVVSCVSVLLCLAIRDIFWVVRCFYIWYDRNEMQSTVTDPQSVSAGGHRVDPFCETSAISPPAMWRLGGAKGETVHSRLGTEP